LDENQKEESRFVDGKICISADLSRFQALSSILFISGTIENNSLFSIICKVLDSIYENTLDACSTILNFIDSSLAVRICLGIVSEVNNYILKL
jgi:hypothetical protein